MSTGEYKETRLKNTVWIEKQSREGKGGQGGEDGRMGEEGGGTSPPTPQKKSTQNQNLLFMRINSIPLVWQMSIPAGLPTDLDKHLNVNKNNQFAFSFLLSNIMHRFTIAIKGYCYVNTMPLDGLCPLFACCPSRTSQAVGIFALILSLSYFNAIFWDMLTPKRFFLDLKTILHESTSLTTSLCRLI